MTLLVAAVLLARAPSLASWTGSTTPTSASTAFAVVRGPLPTTPPRLRAARAPLSTDERGYAVRLALGTLPPTSRDVDGQAGAEVLLADLPLVPTERSRRLVEVVLYDYTDNTTRQATVDLSSGTVASTHSARGVQLPPTPAETGIALQTALSATPHPRFVAEYRSLTHTPLVTAEQVHAIGLTWRSTAAALDTTVSGACASHRCVRLQIDLPSGRYLDTSDFVVDLTVRRLITTPVAPTDQLENEQHDAHHD
ncbi:hypothetical protein [Nocardioides sp.]|uniref:hypothetical protein n=1 Tax=Nocardioides sp. TaxID=35761 RepID=UPI002618EF74|nr:hypothetical protein [Nocardioides sp.]